MLLDLIKNNEVDEKRLVNGVRSFYSSRYKVIKTKEYDLFEVQLLNKDGSLAKKDDGNPIVYFVKPGARTCTCPDFVDNHTKVCKHIIMGALAQDLWLQNLSFKVYNKNKQSA